MRRHRRSLRVLRPPILQRNDISKAVKCVAGIWTIRLQVPGSFLAIDSGGASSKQRSGSTPSNKVIKIQDRF